MLKSEARRFLVRKSGLRVYPRPIPWTGVRFAGRGSGHRQRGAGHLHLKKIAGAHRMRHAANREKVAQINAQSPRDSSSTKIGPPPPLDNGPGSRPELSGRDGPCRPFQKREGQFRCKVGFLSTRSSTLEKASNSLPSPQLLRLWGVPARVHTRPAQSRNSDSSGGWDHQS
jgi:hypothetical protein